MLNQETKIDTLCVRLQKIVDSYNNRWFSNQSEESSAYVKNIKDMQELIRVGQYIFGSQRYFLTIFSFTAIFITSKLDTIENNNFGKLMSQVLPLYYEMESEILMSEELFKAYSSPLNSYYCDRALTVKKDRLLHNYSQSKNYVNILMLAIDSGINLSNDRDSKGETHFQKLLDMQVAISLPLLQKMAKQGTNINNEIDSKGNTMLHLLAAKPISCYDEKSICLEYLLENGKVNLDVRNSKGETPYQILINRVAVIEYDRSTLRIFIANGADINETDRNGNTLLHLLAANPHSCYIPKSEFLEYLLKDCKAKLDVKNSKGETPYQTLLNRPGVIKYGRSTLRILIENGADINEKDRNGNTLVHLLAATPDLDYEQQEQLLTYVFANQPLGSFLDIKNSGQKTPEELAREYNNTSFLAIIKKKKSTFAFSKNPYMHQLYAKVDKTKIAQIREDEESYQDKQLFQL